MTRGRSGGGGGGGGEPPFGEDILIQIAPSDPLLSKIAADSPPLKFLHVPLMTTTIIVHSPRVRSCGAGSMLANIAMCFN